MKCLVCTRLYPISYREQVKKNVTPAIRVLVENAVEQGLDVCAVVRIAPILTRSGLMLPRKRNVDGITVYDLPVLGYRYRYSVLSGRFIRKALGLSVLKYNVIISHMASSFEPAERLLKRNNKDIRHVFVAHASDLGSPLLSYALAKASSIYARSPSLAKRLKYLHKASIDGVLCSGIDKKEIESRPERAIFSIPLRIMFAGRFLPLKNVEASIRAVPIINEKVKCEFHIYGYGPRLREYKELISDNCLKGSVFLHGFMPRHYILERLREMHVFLMPSKPETLGLAFLEAMAKGAVVIGHRGWGVDGIVKDGVNGFLVDSATPEEIAGAVNRYLVSDRRLLHYRSFETASLHTAEMAATRYRNAVEGHDVPSPF